MSEPETTSPPPAPERRTSACCQAPIEDAGTCEQGCCDRWRCTKCGRTWLEEVAD